MDRIQLRRDTAARWAEVNPILLEGEVGYETDTNLRKIGDGVTKWNSLPYLRAEGIVQTTGNSTTEVMSQKATTDKFTELESKLSKITLVGKGASGVSYRIDWFKKGHKYVIYPSDKKWAITSIMDNDVIFVLQRYQDGKFKENLNSINKPNSISECIVLDAKENDYYNLYIQADVNTKVDFLIYDITKEIEDITSIRNLMSWRLSFVGYGANPLTRRLSVKKGHRYLVQLPENRWGVDDLSDSEEIFFAKRVDWESRKITIPHLSLYKNSEYVNEFIFDSSINGEYEFGFRANFAEKINIYITDISDKKSYKFELVSELDVDATMKNSGYYDAELVHQNSEYALCSDRITLQKGQMLIATLTQRSVGTFPLIGIEDGLPTQYVRSFMSEPQRIGSYAIQAIDRDMDVIINCSNDLHHQYLSECPTIRIYNIEKPLTCFSDKKLAIIGDSVTWGVDDTKQIPNPIGFSPRVPQLVYPYPYQVGLMLGFAETYNYGMSSARTLYVNDGSFVWTNRISRLADDADVIGVMMGVNDCASALSDERYLLGELGDVEYNTFYGALNYLYNQLLSKYPIADGKRIFAINYQIDDKLLNKNSENRWIGFAKAIREESEQFSFPLCDKEKTFGVSAKVDKDFTYWGNLNNSGKHSAHYKQVAADIASKVVANFIANHYGK